MTHRETLWRGYLLACACLLFSACLRHEPLPCGQQEACPDGLVCSDGMCVQQPEPTCDGGNCPITVTRCPAQPPADPSSVFAAVDLRCEYGKECCCGACHPSEICSADAGDSFACAHTDSCLIDMCDECAKDADCGSGKVCEADRDAKLVCVPGCRADSDCAPNEKCEQVQCITVPCPPLCTPRDGADMMSTSP